MPRVSGPGALHARSLTLPLALGWTFAIAAAVGVRAWNALAGPLMWGYDAWGHLAYVFFLVRYGAVPWADQGWSYFHPPLHYAIGWILAQAGSPEVLLRGLAALGSVASLASACFASAFVRRVAPERPGLALASFAAVASLPVHLYTAPMPGNEHTAAALVAASVFALARNESRARPTLAGDALAGLLAGLALLAKFNGVLALGTAGLVLGVRALPRLAPAWRGDSGARRDLHGAAARGAVIASVALVVCAPYYARNLREFGHPFQLSRDFPLVAEVEAGHPPGERGLPDLVSIDPRLFVDPDPKDPHLVHSIWGSTYLSMWSDSHRAWIYPAVSLDREIARETAVLTAVGVVPTALSLLGAAACAADVLRGRRREISTALLALAALSLAAYVAFAYEVPIYSGLKASYLMNLSLPYGFFVARALEGLGRRGWRRSATAAGATLAVAVAASLVLHTAGLVRPRKHDGEALGHVRYQMGDLDGARDPYTVRLARFTPDRQQIHWAENLAAVELARGDAARARELYERALRRHPRDPRRANRLAVAAALDGDLAAAHEILDAALAPAGAAESSPELLANRGAVRASAGDVEGALADLRAAVEREPEIPTAWQTLAALLPDGEERTRALRGARESRERAPRRYPWAVGDGEVVTAMIGARPLLLVENGALRLARPQDLERLRDAR
jgi:tetratricopeptide (TPR) repeat protein